MTRSLLLLLVLAVAALAAPPAAKLPAGLPAGAERLSDQQWRHTDAQGKKWIYTRTPFGWSRGAEDKVAKAGPAEEAKPEQKDGQAAPAPPALEVLEVRGDQVVFQRATPFGRSRWTKAKSALDDEEKAALAAARK